MVGVLFLAAGMAGAAPVTTGEELKAAIAAASDMDGEHFGNWCHTHGERVDMCDWLGLLAVDFDGWAYVWCRFAGGLRVDPEKGLENAPWFHIAGTTKKNGKIDFPVKLLAVSF